MSSDDNFQKSNVRKLSDNDIMPIGKYKGQKLGQVPDDHWITVVDCHI